MAMTSQGYSHPCQLTTFAILLLLLILPTLTTAEFQFFNNFFEGQHQQQQQQQQQHGKQNVASDSSWYQQVVDNAQCTHYLCPNTLACVHFPHHCPCAFPAVEDKVELGDGSAICASKNGGGGLVSRKIDLARKGLL